MYVSTWYNNKLSKGIQVVKDKNKKKPEYVVRLGIYMPDRYRSTMKMHRKNPPRVKDGFVFEAYPAKIYPSDWHKRKKEKNSKDLLIPALQDHYRLKDTAMLRVCTLVNGIHIKTSDRKGEALSKMGRKKRSFARPGKWSHLAGKPPIVLAKGFKTVDKDGNELNEKKIHSADDVLELKHGTAILVEAEGSSKIDRQVIYNLLGILHCVNKCDFDENILKPKISETGAKAVNAMPLIEESKIEEEATDEEWGIDPEQELLVVKSKLISEAPEFLDEALEEQPELDSQVEQPV